MKEEICNCKQCQELRTIDRVREWYDNPANGPLTPAEFYMRFREFKTPFAQTILSSVVVLCKDGFIRSRY